MSKGTERAMGEVGQRLYERFMGPAAIIIAAMTTVWLAANRSMGDFSHMFEPAQQLAAGNFSNIYNAETYGTSLTGWLALTAPFFIIGKTFTSEQAAWVLAGLVSIPLLVASVRWSAPLLNSRVTAPTAWLLAALSLLLPTTLANWTEYYHPQDIAGLALMLFALGLAAKKQWGWAGAAFGFAFLTRQWVALVAVLILSVITTKKDSVKFLVSAATVTLLGVAPLIIAGNEGFIEAATGSKAAITAQTWVGRLAEGLSPQALSLLRLTPFVIVTAVAVWVKFTKKVSLSHLVPLAVTGVAARMFFDVAAYTYYWAPICVLMLLLATKKIWVAPTIAVLSSAAAWTISMEFTKEGQLGQLLTTIWVPVIIVILTVMAWILHEPATQAVKNTGERKGSKTSKFTTPTWSWVLACAISAVIVTPSISNTLTFEEENPDGSIPAGMFTGYGVVSFEGEALTRSEEGEIVGAVPSIQTTATILPSGKNGGPVAFIRPGETRAVLVVSHWCGLCVEAPELFKGWLTQQNIPPNQAAILVTDSNENKENWPPELWLASITWTPNKLLDDENSQAKKLLNVTKIPTVLLLASDGTVEQELTLNKNGIEAK